MKSNKEDESLNAKILLFTNENGGSNKTTVSCLVGYEMARLGYKVLMVDDDPQGNCTRLMQRTAQLQGRQVDIEETIMRAIQEGSLAKAVASVMPNLDLLASSDDFGMNHYQDYVANVYMPKSFNIHDLRVKEACHLYKLLQPLKAKYDYIILDTPPTDSIYMASAIVSADYLNIVLQTDEASYEGSLQFTNLVRHIYSNYPNHFQYAGVVLSSYHHNSALDNDVVAKARQHYGKYIYKTVIPWQNRIKRYGIQGISEVGLTPSYSDYWDTKIHNMFKKLAQEVINRVGGK